MWFLRHDESKEQAHVGACFQPCPSFVQTVPAASPLNNAAIECVENLTPVFEGPRDHDYSFDGNPQWLPHITGGAGRVLQA